MSDLSATNCGCGCNDGRECGLNNSCLWIILLLFCCGGNNGYNGMNTCGNDCCLLILLLLFCCGGNGIGNTNGGCGCC
ncbi:chorion class high-cysteine HCB protein 13 [Faecalimonas sp.]